jgi:hypothetical protein
VFCKELCEARNGDMAFVGAISRFQLVQSLGVGGCSLLGAGRSMGEDTARGLEFCERGCVVTRVRDTSECVGLP